MRGPAIVMAAALCAGAPVAAAQPAAKTAEAPPILAFYAPAGAPDSVRAVAGGLDRLARRRGTVLVDLSPPAPPTPRAAEAVRRAIDAYQELRYADANGALDAALAEASVTGAAGLAPAELSDLFLYRALVATQLGDSTRAWEQYLAAATVAPSRHLDPVRFSPSVIETFQRAVTAVAGSATVEVAIDAPAACQVMVDGRALTGLRSVALHAGEHFARIECPDHLPFATRFTVDAGTAMLRPNLQRAPGPDRKRAIAEARRRGGTTLVWAVATADRDKPTVTLELIDLATGKARERVFAPLAGPGAAAALVTEAEALIDRVVAPPTPPIVVADERHWYESPWLWGAVGVAVATAVLLPFAIDSPPATGWDSGVPYPP